jgi:NADPH-dependent glutamate synthase beta subunit-like oxidoreductase/NAD(P)H-flavin reductase
MLTLAHGLAFADLYSPAGLVRIDRLFLEDLARRNAALAGRLSAARAQPEALAPLAESELLIALGPEAEDFIARLFGIVPELSASTARHKALDPLWACKRNFVQRVALKRFKAEEAAGFDADALGRDLETRFGEALNEDVFARHVEIWLADEAESAAALDVAARYAAWATLAPAGRKRHGRGVLFKAPGKVDPMALVPSVVDASGGVPAHVLPRDHLRRREGFALTDLGADLAGALDQANYCIWCHAQGKDSCSRGLTEKAKAPGRRPPFKTSPFGVTLAGCPLEEKISEMHALKAQGHAIGALAMIAVDNPLAAMTGHRICNDCMKSCIYQKQQPVDIPQVETRALKDVLALPWGFEIYSLLTRWNPLNIRRPYPRPATGKKVLIAGLGPAGISLAHHLMNDGHGVVAIDGLKIEPLPERVSGVRPDGARVPFEPVHDIETLYERLDERVMAGFGGVAEYGITVRWNKNFLKIVRLVVERRAECAIHGGVRLGGTITIEDAFAMGFDHVALAMGAGKPTVLDLPNGLARGVRTASDFLMALQLTGAAKSDSIANMQLRLPVVVIGGGLTAIDTATESLAYYPVQVEKFLARYEALAAEGGEASLRGAWSDEEREIADEFLTHARAIRAERAAAAKEGRAPRVVDLLQSWGGVTLAYRKRMIDSPSYTLNHEEIEKALEEGIRFAECLAPVAVETDAQGHVRALKLAWQILENGAWRADPAVVELPARAVLVAAGTQPNTVLAREDDGIELDGRYFRALDEAGEKASPERLAKPEKPVVLAELRADGRAVSFFGDLHPSFAGNVVKAMGGVKQGYPILSRVLAKHAPADARDLGAFFGALDRALRPRVRRVERLTPSIVEIVVEAPKAARAFRPGQFYRLQNFESLAPQVDGTRLAMEGLALTGAWVDAAAGTVGLIALEMGGSSDLCATLRPGEPVVLMGPTGTATELPKGETVLLVGGGLGNAVLFSIGAGLRAAGSKVLYFAGYKRLIDRYKVAEIEAAADVVVWACDEAPGFRPTRPRDKSFVGNIVEALEAYASGALGPQAISLGAVDRLIAIGSDRMMDAVGRARRGVLAKDLARCRHGVASINSPMQCMMKEICAQCLQPHRDPATGATTYVFSCFNQDQDIDRVDFAALAERLAQNAVQQKLTARWVDRCLRRLGLRGA